MQVRAARARRLQLHRTRDEGAKQQLHSHTDRHLQWAATLQTLRTPDFLYQIFCSLEIRGVDASWHGVRLVLRRRSGRGYAGSGGGCDAGVHVPAAHAGPLEVLVGRLLRLRRRSEPHAALLQLRRAAHAYLRLWRSANARVVQGVLLRQWRSAAHTRVL